MKTDRTTKVLLAAIALALWLNVIGSWVTPPSASAQGVPSYRQLQLDRAIGKILGHVADISNGRCRNPKICE